MLQINSPYRQGLSCALGRSEGGATVAITFDTNNPEAVGVANIRPYSVERVLGRMGAYLIMAESVPPGEHVVID